MKPFWSGQIKTKSSSGLRSSALTKIPNWKVLWTEFYEHIFMEPDIIFRKEDLLKRPLERRVTKVRTLSRVGRWRVSIVSTIDWDTAHFTLGHSLHSFAFHWVLRIFMNLASSDRWFLKEWSFQQLTEQFELRCHRIIRTLNASVFIQFDWKYEHSVVNIWRQSSKEWRHQASFELNQCS